MKYGYKCLTCKEEYCTGTHYIRQMPHCPNCNEEFENVVPLKVFAEDEEIRDNRLNLHDLIYVGSPYNHKDPMVRQHRYEQVRAYVAKLGRDGLVAYSPIIHWHPMAVHHELPKGFDFWEKADLTILSKSTSMRVLQLKGWKESVGLQAEIDFAHRIELPITYIKE